MMPTGREISRIDTQGNNFPRPTILIVSFPHQEFIRWNPEAHLDRGSWLDQATESREAKREARCEVRGGSEE